MSKKMANFLEETGEEALSLRIRIGGRISRCFFDWFHGIIIA